MAAGFRRTAEQRNRIAQRTKTALETMRLTGAAFNHAPYGFDRYDDEFLQNEEEADIIRRMVALRGVGLSYRRIANTFNGRGIGTKRGCQWDPKTVKRTIDNYDRFDFR